MSLESFKMSKGMKFDLDKPGDTYHRLRVVLSWDASVYGNATFDADLTLAVLENVGVRPDGSPRRNIYAEDPNYLVYYNSQKVKNKDGIEVIMTPKGEIIHTGDDRDGSIGEEADINLDLLANDAVEIPIVGTIHKGAQRNQNWADLKAKLMLINIVNNEVLAEIDLGNKLPNMTAVHFASIYREQDSKWTFQAVESGYDGGLETFIEFWTT